MTLPNFLVIGAQRCGTSWLYQQLKNHPEIYLNKTRKEIHYFDRYYSRGIKWYEKFFPADSQTIQNKWIGESTPDYLYCPEAPRRIYETLGDCKFIVMVRNPAKRAYSSYCRIVKNHSYSKDFSEYLQDYPHAFKRGMYADYLENYLEYFPINNFLFLVFEEVFKSPAESFQKISNFLDINDEKFIDISAQKKVNTSYMVKHKKAYAFALSLTKQLNHYDLHWLYKPIQHLGIHRAIFRSKSKFPSIEKDDEKNLLSKYEKDISRLEDLTGLNLLPLWQVENR